MTTRVEVYPVFEGGAVTIAFHSDSDAPQSFARMDITIDYSLGEANGSFTSTGVFYRGDPKTALNVSQLPADDRAVTGDGLISIHGSVIINGQVIPVNYQGPIVDNDNAQYVVDLSYDLGASRNITFNHGGLTTTEGGRTFIKNLLQTNYQTGLAVASYQFFTSNIPMSEGISYLLGNASNPNGLYSAYYSSFNRENRFINFASNLGLHGEGADAFKRSYGGLSMHDAVVKAYAEIVGLDRPDAVAAIEASAPYFQALAHQRIGGPDFDLSAKAAMVGYIMSEALKSDVGVYARAIENYYLDLSDGVAMDGVSLIGAYGPGTFLDKYGG